MNREDIERQLSQTKTFLLAQNVPRVDLLMKQIKLLDRFLKDGNAMVSGPCLVYQAGGRVECRAFKRRIEVGRSADAELFIEAPGLSRKHFAVTPMGDEGTVLEDLKSKNKTMVNDVETDRAVLVPGDVINAGDILFIYLED